MDFIAIDFETANEKRNSPCSIGLAIIKNNEIVERIHYLIKPKEMRFVPINISIHGITPSLVKNELEFDKIWTKIKKYFDNTLIIAHNASFDISVLRSTLTTYNIEFPNFKYICTMKLSRNYYKNLENAKLNTVNRFLGYNFNHHDALADALACTNILLNISKDLNINDINEISKLLGVTIGTVTKDGYTPSSAKGIIKKTSNKIGTSNTSIIYNIRNNIAFENEFVVFTGKLSSLSREEAMMIVRKTHGTVCFSVSKKTTILVTNLKNLALNLDEMTTKHKKAVTLINNGYPIKILSEDEFINRFNNI